ncbi:MAG TPA: DUF6600 domain-containing protein [Patescibacteria group bacterium]|nr:DUF6600 domain-containing protein [Patescibacteria group bacterium]
MRGFLAKIAILALALASTAGVGRAQDQAPQETGQQNQSQLGVARVSLIEGNVSIERADSGTWVAATVNTPLMNGDTISTGPDSRAEVQLDYANVLRLDSSSTAKIANLDRSHIQVQVSQGLVSYDVLNQDQAQAEVDTPNVAVHPLGNGSYRVEVDSNAQTLVTVRRGEADVSTPQGSTRIENGQLITIQGTDNPQYQISSAGPEDSWDQWNSNRDRRIEDASTWHYTNHHYTGAQDLGSYGHWVYVPSYGNVWQPYQSAGWAPYRDGRWVWEPFYGWTWVSYEPWGWAPYHYGRWFLYDDDWSWWPGPVAFYPAYYPVWSPAYVSFFGFGYGGGGFSFGASFGFGNVGWLPCGPADPYFPWYGGGRRFNVINITNIGYMRDDYRRYGGFGPLYRGRGGYSNFGSVLRDRRLRDGASWMSGREFGHARVPRQQGHIDAAAFREGRMFSGRVPVLPTRESLRSTNRAPDPATMRRGISSHERFFTKSRPAPAQRSFSEQRARLERTIQGYHSQSGRRAGGSAFTLGARGRSGFNAGQPGSRNGSQSHVFGRAGAASPNFTKAPNGSRPFGNSGRQHPAPALRAPAQRGAFSVTRPGGATSPRSGWHGFGQPNRGATGNGARMGQGHSAPAFTPNNRGGARAPAQRRGNFQTFTPSARQSRPVQLRSFPAQAPANRRGWKTFTPQQRQPRQAPAARGGHSAPVQTQAGGRSFTPFSRPASPRGGRGVQPGRQPLNLRQPIVQRPSHRYQAPRNGNNGPRSFGGGPAYGGRNVYRGGAGRAPSRPSYQAPRRAYGGGGGYRGGGGSPRGGGHPQGGGGHAAPRGRSGGGSSNSSGGQRHGR